MAEKENRLGRLALQPRTGLSRQSRRSKGQKMLALRENPQEGAQQPRIAKGRQFRTAKQPRSVLPLQDRLTALQEISSQIDIIDIGVIKVQFARRMQPHQLASLKSRTLMISRGSIVLPPVVKVSTARVAQVRQRSAIKSAKFLSAK